ncbi:MAG: cyclopropane-fatty-acyl-phospholipid synthase family protein [Desulfobacula sp.]|jgi:cyclopropane-fatty-acyl-phospholipid synthase
MKTLKESFFLKKFIETLEQGMIPLEIIDTGGNRFFTAGEEIKHRLHIKNRKFFNALISPNALSLGEAYIKGYFDISGSIKELYELVCTRLLHKNQRKNPVQYIAKLFVNPRQKEKENIEYHYDAPSEFYRMFLGETMGYTCGYYPDENTGMDDAQIEKMDIVCRKLRLKPDEALLDIGCGWGNFAVYAAKQYGVNVTGITLSSEQKTYAERWVEKEGLTRKIKIKIQNYRDLGLEKFDKISCVGMSEHVGKKNMQDFFQTVYRSLKKGGLFMQHTITTHQKQKKGYENTFLNRYMFPGGELMLEHELIDLAASSGFELLTAENFRAHYIKTLNDWIIRMEEQKDLLLKIISDQIYRIYHIFFIGSLISFRDKEISLFQNLFYKTDDQNIKTDHFISLYSKNETRIA